MKKIAWASSYTGIGSLPHHNLDAALKYSFEHTLPFLPQIPKRNDWEYMIPQALEGLPGLHVEPGGATNIDLGLWSAHFQSFQKRLDQAFEDDDFEIFEPTAAVSSSWLSFLWELGEQKPKSAKIQIGGPLTCTWMVPPNQLAKNPELEGKIFKLILARALAMVKKISKLSIQPLLIIDEPGLMAFKTGNPAHEIGLKQLAILIQKVRSEGAAVGIHCCAQTDWHKLFSLGIDLLSIDSSLSLESIQPIDLEPWLESGGILGLGLVPTQNFSQSYPRAQAQEIALQTKQTLKKLIGPEKSKAVLRESVLSASCGLATISIQEAQWILDSLKKIHAEFQS